MSQQLLIYNRGCLLPTGTALLRRLVHDETYCATQLATTSSTRRADLECTSDAYEDIVSFRGQ
jgi:hypothetical protein